jgi:hypothetical protein
MAGTARMGIYPGLPDKMVQFVVADIDGHQPGQDAKTDSKTIMRIASDMSIPIMAFSSNSGNGYHVYLFFSEPTEYRKAAGIMAKMLDRCPGLTALDCIKPSQATDGGTGGGLIALPFHKAAFDARKSTVPVDHELNPIADDFDECLEYFEIECDPLSPERVNELIKEYSVDVSEKPEARPVDPELMARMSGQLSPCMTHILNANPKTKNSNFNKLVMTIVKFMLAVGFTHDEAISTCSKFLNTYQYSGTYTTPQARTDHFTAMWRYLSVRNDSKFRCSYVLGLKLRGSAFSCSECQLHEHREQISAEKIASWGKPEPLLNSIPNAPMLPIDCLPGVILDFCTDTAERMQVQVESILIVVLVTFAGCIGKNALISPRAKDNWRERICLWACLILQPGMKKSPMLDAGILPLKRIQARYADQHVKELEDWNKAFSAGKQKQKAWEKSCAKVLSKNPSAELGEDPMVAIPPKPSPRRTYTADCTIEKMVDIMNRSPGLTQVSDELSGFLLNMNRYSKGSDRQFYLKCKTGGGHPVDRVGRGEEFVDDLYLNIVGGIQPKVAKRLFSPKDGEGDDGFFERFGLVILPNPMTSYEHVDRYPNKNALDNYYGACEKLAGCNWAEQLTTDEHLPGKGIARFDTQAQEAFNQWDVKHGRAMLSQHDDDSLNTMLSKAPGLLVQLAFLFHLADWADNVCVDVSAVNFRAFDRARVFLEDYLIPMWKRILFAFADDGGESAAQKIGKWLVQESIKSFTIRDIKQKHWINLKNNDEIEVSIVVLIEKNWIMEAGKKSTGGRSTVKYAVNPAIYETVT